MDMSYYNKQEYINHFLRQDAVSVVWIVWSTPDNGEC